MASSDESKSVLSVSNYGEVDGKQVSLYKIIFPGKLEAQLTNYGGIITSLSIPDKDGKMEDIVLGYDNLEEYVNENPYFGALIGRYGNRIAEGQFSLEEKVYTLSTNNGPNHLHGGTKGFDKIVWNTIRTEERNGEVQVALQHISEDGEEAYPGTLTCIVTYTFTEEGVFIDYKATTDKKTIINLTHHTYFNLSGNVKESILNHKLVLDANNFLPVDSTLIPTGEIRSVAGTPFDFKTPKMISQDIMKENQQLEYAGGYDHCWVLDGGITTSERKAAILHHEESGRYMEVFTKEPAIQFYSGNFLDGSIVGKNGTIYHFRDGLCLETQHFPNAPNQPDFPSVILDVGETYQTSTSYKFSVR